MAHRAIGQERLDLADRPRAPSSLDELNLLIDWRPVAALLEPLCPAAKGEPAWPPLAMFKALLPSVWYGLSDVKLAEALDDRGSFRRFCGFARHEATPERTAFVRDRRLLVAHGLDGALFEAVTAQLKAKAIRVKSGTLVDATIITSASQGDEEGRWVKHKGRAAVHGFKAHVGADAATALVEKVAVMPANGNDGRAGPEVNRPGFLEAPDPARMEPMTKRPPPISPEVRERAVRMVLDHRHEHGSMSRDPLDRGRDRLLGRDAAQLGPPGRT